MKWMLVALVVMSVGACQATKSVWDGSKEDQYVEVTDSAPDIEEKLLASGVSYYCVKVLYSTKDRDKVCYVKKFSSKTNEFVDKMYKTPKAVVTDTAVTIIVVGTVSFQVVMAVCSATPGGCHN